MLIRKTISWKGFLNLKQRMYQVMYKNMDERAQKSLCGDEWGTVRRRGGILTRRGSRWRDFRKLSEKRPSELRKET